MKINDRKRKIGDETHKLRIQRTPSPPPTKFTVECLIIQELFHDISANMKHYITESEQVE